MENFKENLKGLYLLIKKDNFNFQISQNKLNEKVKNFPNWMEKQIDFDLKIFENKKIDINKTIENLKEKNLLKEAHLIRVRIKNNKLKYQNFLSNRFNARFIRFHNFLKKALKLLKFEDVDFLFSFSNSLDNQKLLECLQAPVFCISKNQNSQNIILFPQIERVNRNDLLLSLTCKADLQLSWEKKLSTAFWRGETIFFSDFDKDERLDIIKLSNHYPHLIDAAFCKIDNLSQNDQQRLLENFIIKPDFNPIDQLKYKYLLSMDNGALEDTFYLKLFSPSVVLKSKTEYQKWYYQGLKEDKHFLEFDSKKDLISKIHWLKDNDKKAKKISENANIFAKENLSNENILAYVYRLLNRQSELINYH